VKFKVTHHKQVRYRNSWTLYGEEYDDWNSDIFRWRRNCSSDGAERTAFHARAAAAGKARSPRVVRRVDGTTSVDVEALRIKTPTWTCVGGQVEGLSEVWWRHAVKATNVNCFVDFNC